MLGCKELARQVCRQKYNISLPFWELDRIDEKHTKLLGNYDKILAPSRFVERVMRSHGLDQVEAIRHPFCLPDRDPSFEVPRDRLDVLFYFDFDSFPARKNPEAAVLAFQKAFEREKDARLTIKVRGQNDSGRRAWLARQISSDPRINVIDRFMTRSELGDLMHSHDVFVSLHRSEGLGLGLAEAMAAGKIVVATDYGGSTDFVNLQTGYPVQFDQIPVGDDEYVMADGATWADPSVEHAAELLRAIYTDPEEAKIRAERGFRHLSEFHSFSAAGKKIAENLQKQGVLSR